MNLICGKTRFGIFQKASSHLSEWFNSVMKLTMILNKHMSSCQLIVTVLMKFPPPPKNPPQNALYHIAQMVLVDPCDRLISRF